MEELGFEMFMGLMTFDLVEIMRNSCVNECKCKGLCVDIECQLRKDWSKA